MKHIKKLAGLLLALTMVFVLATAAFAQDVGTDATGKGTITISNAAKGETYSVYKLFNATVSVADGKIAYTGDIPTGLEAYFTADSEGNITATEAAKSGENMSDGLKEALATWAKGATPSADPTVSDGSTLNFKGLDYGYYVITSTQGGTNTISVDSTNPTAEVVDKNSTTPSGLEKKVPEGGDNVNIGDTVTYTVKFKTANYDGTKQITSYTITDTLPDFLKDVTVTSITIDGVAYEVDGKVPQFDAVKKSITIPWANEDGTSLYKNGAVIEITYTAVVTEKAAIAGTGNTNNVTVTWTTTEGSTTDKLETSETIYTYAIALKKVNEKGAPLSGAVFQLPFYVKKTADTDGAYIYAGTASGDDLTNQLTTPEDGVIVVKGVKAGKYEITEVTAPNGYNKLTASVIVKAKKTEATTTHTTFYLDENGNVVDTKSETTVDVKYDNEKLAATAILVVNKAGTELPSTGGIGTTIFYVLGSILVIGAAVLLVTKKRMGDAE